MMNCWYVIQTKPKKEENARHYLTVKGLESFFPLMETYTNRNGKMVNSQKPLFPSYIFGNFNMERDYSLVRWARGVKKILGTNGVPIPLSEEVIAEIKRRIDGEGVVKIHRNFRPNDPVRIHAGPFQDFLGIFEGWIPETERVRVLLNCIGYQPKVALHVSMIEKAN